MPREITDLEVLKEYISGVMERAEHHADNVSDIALALVGAIVWCKDDQPIEVREHKGEMANVIWVSIGGQRYALSYNHENKFIDMKLGSLKGEVVKSFSNTMPISDLKRFFSSL